MIIGGRKGPDRAKHFDPMSPENIQARADGENIGFWADFLESEMPELTLIDCPPPKDPDLEEQHLLEAIRVQEIHARRIR